MPKSDLIEVCGMLTGVSHIFMLKSQQLFIFDISSGEGTSSVIVRKQSQLSWQASLKVGAFYTCYNLKQAKLYQGTKDEVNVLVAVSQTGIAEGTTHDIHFAEDKSSNFISYEGTVTAADQSLQLFELDNSCQLVLSSIAVITSCPQLRCGDRVIVHDGHWDPAERRLYACGRTHVRLLDRPPEPVVSSKQTFVHTLHRFTLPPSLLEWYRQTAKAISAAARERVPVDGEKSVIHRLLKLEKLPLVERSLTKEFACRPHRCIVTQQFVAPFQLSPLPDLISAAVSDSAPPEPRDGRGWHHWVGVDSGRRTVALLVREQAGEALLVAGDCRVPLLLLPPRGDHPPEEGLVCVNGPRLVVERLRTAEPSVYLLCTGDQVVALEDAPTDPEPAPVHGSGDAAAAPVRLLLDQRSSPRRAAGGVCVLLHGLLEEPTRRRPALLWLTGATAARAADLTRGTAYRLQSAERHWTAREQGCGQLLKPLRPWLVDCAVIRAPDDLQFIADDRGQSAAQLTCDAVSVSELTRGATDDGLLTVRGVIAERCHARDRFARPPRGAGVSFETHRVVLRLSDPVTPDEVPLYICEPSQWASLLGLVPGAALTAHAVRWAGGTSSTPGTHLVTTPLSELELTGWSPPPEQPGARRPRLHLPMVFLSAALSDPSVTRWIACVTVADLCRVSLAAQCGLCGHRLAAGTCGFVGCHGQGRHVINAGARAVLDDGSAAVTAQLIGDSVRQLLAVTDTQWRTLTEEAAQSGEIFHLQPRPKGDRTAGPVGLLSSVCQSDAIRRPVVCELKKFTGHPPSATAGGAGGAAQAVFCESVMEGTASVVTRLYPGPAAPQDVQMAG